MLLSLPKIKLLLLLLVCCNAIQAQLVTIKGNVYDATRRTPLESVAVLTSSGKGELTDSIGGYEIKLYSTDTIYFSYQGKSTNKFAVKNITNPGQFDVSIQVIVKELPTVIVRSRNYILDSLQNRKDYKKIFDFKKPRLETTESGNLSVTSLINMFRVRRNRQILSLQKRLLEQEQDKYIDKRYSKRLVIKLTALKEPEIDSFMNAYRPGYNFVLTLNDIELGAYIQQCFTHYNLSKQGIFTPNPSRISSFYNKPEEE